MALTTEIDDVHARYHWPLSLQHFRGGDAKLDHSMW